MTTLSVSPPFPIFSNRDGSPLENGYIWVGTANVNPITNPIAVYWDAALTQPAGQPIRTINGYPSNSGTPGRLYIGAADYSIQVQDSKGSLVYGSSNRTERIGDISADQVTFVQAGTTFERTVQDKLEDVISFEDFGAVGDNLADDTLAMQAAIDSFLTNPNGQGGIVMGKPGAKYKITDTLILRSLVKIDLAGAAIIQYGNNRPIISAPTGSLITGWSLKNGLLGYATQQTTANTNSIGIRLAHQSFSYDFVIDQIQVIAARVGIGCPSDAGTFAFVGQIQNYIGNDCSDWSMAIDCDSAAGGNTNLVLTNCWALISNPTLPALANAKGFFFNACSMFQWQSLYADRIKDRFIFCQTSSGWFGVCTLEAAEIEVGTSNALALVELVDSSVNFNRVQFVLNDLRTYNQMVANVTGTVAVGVTITGAGSGATAKVRTTGTGAGTTITFYEINGVAFTPGENILVGGVPQGTVTSLPGSSGQIYMLRGASTQFNRPFACNLGQFGANNNTYNTVFTGPGTNIWDVSVTPNTSGPPASGAYLIYNNWAETDRGAPRLADFGSPLNVRTWNGVNRYYTLGMTADVAYDGVLTNLQATAMNAANSYSTYVTNPSDRNLRFNSTAFAFNRDGGLTFYSVDGSGNEVSVTKALRLRTNAGGQPRLSMVGPEVGTLTETVWEALTEVSGVETRRLGITQAGNITAGASAALATNATDGFLYVPTCAGTPTGTPTAITGMAPIVVNTTNNKLYFYSGGSWRDAGP
jgi:hypothetical protein